MIDFLSGAGFEVIIPEAQVGPYRIDALLAEEWIAFEADGAYWHSSASDVTRDGRLLREHKLPVVRLSEKEINAWPKIVYVS